MPPPLRHPRPVARHSLGVFLHLSLRSSPTLSSGIPERTVWLGKSLDDDGRSESCMKLLFVHEHLGALGGAEANIFLTAKELQRRGHTVALLYGSGTGRNEDLWRQTC